MFYENYEKIRDSKGFTDYKVAKEAGIVQSTFTDWKKGSTPRLEKLVKIADALGIKVEDITSPPQSIDAELPFDIIDVKTQLLLKNELLHRLLLAGGKVYENDPKFVESILYTLEKMGENK